ncbi:MAG: hypothetical protein LAO04_17715 [Acidobacteriia bacterium]|nr:hypothetical protein [Terriglobia bacterium]
MNRYETALLVAFATFSLPTFALYHVMVFKVNQQLPPDRRIPHRSYWGGWSRLREEHKGFFPRSFLYQAAVTGAVMCLLIALAVAGFRFWEYWAGG